MGAIRRRIAQKQTQRLVATAEQQVIAFRPQPCQQEQFHASAADIAIYGGAAGGGKTYGSILETLRHKDVPDFYSVFFRRSMPQIHNPGALWDTSRKVYPLTGAVPKEQPSEWRWPLSGARVKMAHLEHESTVEDWQGSQVPLFLFDELTHFTRSMFFYMMSRNRSECGVRPYMRATCNPDPDSWVADFIGWWINQETGYAIPERSGKLRWFIRRGDDLVWADSRDEVLAKVPGANPVEAKSLTFVPAKLEDNKILETANPEYRGNLLAMTRVIQERLLGGNWKIRANAGSYFRRSDCHIIEEVPNDVVSWTRRWDLAATEPCESSPDPDFTCGLKMGKRKDGRFVVAHVDLVRRRANDVRALVRRVAENDGRAVWVGIPQDPAQAGKDQAESYIRDLAGFKVYADHETGDKETRAEPAAAQWQHGNIDVVRGEWNEDFFGQLEAFPAKGTHDDAVDALSGAFKRVSAKLHSAYGV